MGRLTTLNRKLSLTAFFPLRSVPFRMYRQIYLQALVQWERIADLAVAWTCTVIFVNNVPN